MKTRLTGLTALLLTTTSVDAQIAGSGVAEQVEKYTGFELQQDPQNTFRFIQVTPEGTEDIYKPGQYQMDFRVEDSNKDKRGSLLQDRVVDATITSYPAEGGQLIQRIMRGDPEKKYRPKGVKEGQHFTSIYQEDDNGKIIHTDTIISPVEDSFYKTLGIVLARANPGNVRQVTAEDASPGIDGSAQDLLPTASLEMFNAALGVQMLRDIPLNGIDGNDHYKATGTHDDGNKKTRDDFTVAATYDAKAGDALQHAEIYTTIGDGYISIRENEGEGYVVVDCKPNTALLILAEENTKSFARLPQAIEEAAQRFKTGTARAPAAQPGK